LSRLYNASSFLSTIFKRIGGSKKMKRLTVFALLLPFITTVSPAQTRTRPSMLKIIQLPTPVLTGPVSLEEAIARRRSVRTFTDQKLSFVSIGQLAWAGQGITDKQRGFRTAPSAGAIYPITLYFATGEGLFVYKPEEHTLEATTNQDLRPALARAASNQEAVAQAACNVIVTGSVRKVAAKYRHSAERFMLLEAGHVAQNILLEAVSLGLGAVPIGSFDINQVRKVCTLPRTLEPVYLICVGHPATQATAEPVGQVKETKVKKAALIIASERFRDEELFETNRQLQQARVQTIIASTKTGIIRGMLGGKAEAEILIGNLQVNDYDAIVFIGGSGAREYFNNPVALAIARDAVAKRKVLGAICIAPSVLANAGVLTGVRVTSYPSERGKLRSAGAVYTGDDVERDGLIITANGPMAAKKFGETIAQALFSR